MIKAEVYSHGDSSVGINGYNAIVELDIYEFESGEERDFIADSLTKMFSEIWDDRAYIRFYDEQVEPYGCGYHVVEREV